MHRIDGPGATAENLFTDGNPLTGTPATVVLAKWLNNLQEEICTVIEEAGGTLDQNSSTQLYDAIVAIATGGGTTITAASVPIEDEGGYFEGSNVELALQELAAALASGTTAASRIRRSVVALSGAANNIASGHFENLVEVTHSATSTYTILADGTPTAPIGTSITIFQAGAGQVEAAAGAGVTLHVPAGFVARTYGQHAALVLAKVAANTWRVGGTLEAAP